jgi:TonB-linked SusC/RagA family outer membrane protein
MEKKSCSVPIKGNFKKLLLIMKLCVLFLLVSTATLMASSGYSQNTRLSVHLENVTLKELITHIESQTEFIFVLLDGVVDLNKEITVDVQDQTIDKILDKVFESSGNSYKIFDRQIAIGKKEIVRQLEVLRAEVNLEAEQPQKKEIAGTVKDENGNPLPGVSVVLKGTTTGTVTDAGGNYTFQVPLDARTLVFSFVGMKTQEIEIGNKAVIHVVMAEETMGIEEVVAIGYGTVKRKDLTGSVSSVSGQTLKDIPVSSASDAIAGRMAGVQVTRTDGSPDAEIKIRVRGGGSITQDNSPLYIVDGLPVASIDDIPPTDIESLDVLKDASSTAIYGARGANGVILITTKGGFEGKDKVSYNTYFGVKDITKTFEMMDPYEFVLWQYELNQGTGFERYFGAFGDIDLYKYVKGTDWQEELFGRTGTNMYHNLSFSGGSKKSKYSISLTQNDAKEIMLGSAFSRTNLNVKTTNQINKWLSVDLNVMLSDNLQKGAGTYRNYTLQYIGYRPTKGLSDYVDPDLVNADDYEGGATYNLDPVNMTNDTYRRAKNLSFNFSGALNVSLTKNLKYRFEYGSTYGENTTKLFYGINTPNVQNYGGSPVAGISKTDVKSARLANLLTYSKKDFLPGNNLTLLLGEELYSYKSAYISDQSRYFPIYIDAVSALSMMQLGIPQPTSVMDNPANRLSSFFGRLNYDYKGKYLVTATVRADGSSKFAPGNQWGYFPSAALAWRVSDENFMKSTGHWLSALKLRASYGESGNNRISDNAWKKTFSVLSGVGPNSGGVYMSGDESTATAYLAPNSILSNPELKWETTETMNAGLDFGFFKQRLSGTFEIYKNTTKDLLIQATVPSSTGYSKQWQNIGQTSNRGIELTLNGVIVEKKDFKLSASFNIAFNRNRIDKLGDTKQWEQTSMWLGWSGTGTVAGDYLIKEGGQVGQMYGYETEGMYSIDDFYYDFANKTYILKEDVPNDNALIGAKRFWPGALKLKDQNGDLIVNSNDKVVIGNANPKHTGGFSLTAQYKGFDATAFLNWVYGNDLYNANKLWFALNPFSYSFRNELNVMNSDNRFSYFSKETGELVSDPVQLAEMNKNATLWSPNMINMQLHSWCIEDGSFLRLNTVTLGYSLPRNIINRLGLSKLRIYATAYNVWTWTKYSGYDPEVDMVRTTPLTPGIDWSAFPRSRSFNFGLNVEF